MPVFHRNGQSVLLAHIPKTGGTFVEATFKRNGFDIEFLAHGPSRGFLNKVMRVSPQHLHWALLEQLFDLSAFDYAFAIVRHPLERLVSEYRMRVKAGQIPFDDWAQRALIRARKDPSHLDNHLRPQVEFLGPGLRVFKLEAVPSHAWATEIRAALGGAPFEMQAASHANAGDAISSLKRSDVHISSRTRTAVADFYAADFEQLGYDLPVSDDPPSMLPPRPLARAPGQSTVEQPA